MSACAPSVIPDPAHRISAHHMAKLYTLQNARRPEQILNANSFKFFTFFIVPEPLTLPLFFDLNERLTLYSG